MTASINSVKATTKAVQQPVATKVEEGNFREALKEVSTQKVDTKPQVSETDPQMSETTPQPTQKNESGVENGVDTKASTGKNMLVDDKVIENKNQKSEINKATLAQERVKEQIIEMNKNLQDQAFGNEGLKNFVTNDAMEKQNLIGKKSDDLKEKEDLIKLLDESAFLPFGQTEVNVQKDALANISELNSKISALNTIKNLEISAVESKDLKGKKDAIKSIAMNAQDADFFLNLVQNKQNTDFVQANINTVQNQIQVQEVKNQVIQSSAAVSQALIDSLNESMKTNKPFRVDFDNNVAVIMKVDSNGVLSANFIPGSSAVEQYLRNNIAELRQAFEDKGIEYNELSYTSKKQNNSQKQNRGQRGGNNE